MNGQPESNMRLQLLQLHSPKLLFLSSLTDSKPLIIYFQVTLWALRIRHQQLQPNHPQTRPLDQLRQPRPLDQLRQTRPLDQLRQTRPLDQLRQTRPLDQVQPAKMFRKGKVGNPVGQRPLRNRVCIAIT